MRPLAVFMLVLVTGLALLTMIAWSVVQRTARAWFERDLALRAQLAVRGAEPTLLAAWNGAEGTDVHGMLSSMVRDERIVAAAVCRSDLSLLAATDGFPDAFDCGTIGARLRQADSTLLPSASMWTTREALASGRVHLSAVPLVERGESSASSRWCMTWRFSIAAKRRRAHSC